MLGNKLQLSPVQRITCTAWHRWVVIDQNNFIPCKSLSHFKTPESERWTKKGKFR